QIERVGGDETIRTDVRVIAATNAELEKLADEGRFRKDLFFRLNVFTIALPALRDRGDDVRLLIEHYVRRFGREFNKPVEVAPEAMELLRNYAWPGNVRELQSVLKQSLLQAGGSVLLADHLPAQVAARLAAPVTEVTSSGDAEAAVVWDRFVAGQIAEGTE